MKGVEQPPQYHPEGDVWIHTRMMLEGLGPGTSPALAWGVLLHDVGKPPTFRSAATTGDRIRFDGHVEVGVPMAEAICKRLRFSGEDTEQVKALVANHMKFKDVAPDAQVHAEAICPATPFRRAPGVAPARLRGEPRKTGCLRDRSQVTRRDTTRTGSPCKTIDRGRSKGYGI